MASSLCIPLSRSQSRKPFRRTLLQRMLHNFSALAPAYHLDGITYQPNWRKRDFCVPRICAGTCKSFVALLLPALFPVSPLLHYSYKKIGGTPPFPDEPGQLKAASAAKYLCCLSLTRNRVNARKIAQCFLSLTDIISRNYQCCLSLRKKGRGAALLYFLSGAFAPAFPGAGAADAMNVHGGTVSAVGDTCNGVRLFLLSSALNATRSCDSMVFHDATVALYCLQSASQVSTWA
jgi:hypothetical protein